MSKYTKFPTPIDCSNTFSINEVMVIIPTSANIFEVSNIYFGIYSMSGIKVRLGFGF